MTGVDIAQIIFWVGILVLGACILFVQYKKHSFWEKTKNTPMTVDLADGLIKANNIYWDEKLWALRLFNFIKFWK